MNEIAVKNGFYVLFSLRFLFVATACLPRRSVIVVMCQTSLLYRFSKVSSSFYFLYFSSTSFIYVGFFPSYMSVYFLYTCFFFLLFYLSRINSLDFLKKNLQMYQVRRGSNNGGVLSCIFPRICTAHQPLFRVVKCG